MIVISIFTPELTSSLLLYPMTYLGLLPVCKSLFIQFDYICNNHPHASNILLCTINLFTYKNWIFADFILLRCRCSVCQLTSKLELSAAFYFISLKVKPTSWLVMDWSRILQGRVKIGSLQTNKFEPGRVTVQRVLLLLPSLINNIYFVIYIGLIKSYLRLWHLILLP